MQKVALLIWETRFSIRFCDGKTDNLKARTGWTQNDSKFGYRIPNILRNLNISGVRYHYAPSNGPFRGRSAAGSERRRRKTYQQFQQVIDIKKGPEFKEEVRGAKKESGRGYRGVSRRRSGRKDNETWSDLLAGQVCD